MRRLQSPFILTGIAERDYEVEDLGTNEMISRKRKKPGSGESRGSKIPVHNRFATCPDVYYWISLAGLEPAFED